MAFDAFWRLFGQQRISTFVRAPWRCNLCGCEAVATIKVEPLVSIDFTPSVTEVALLPHRHWSDSEAGTQERAERAFPHAAARALKLAKCPKCGDRHTNSVLWHWSKYGLPALTIPSVTTAPLLLLSLWEPELLPAAIFLGLSCMFIGTSILWRGWSRWSCASNALFEQRTQP